MKVNHINATLEEGDSISVNFTLRNVGVGVSSDGMLSSRIAFQRNVQ